MGDVLMFPMDYQVCYWCRRLIGEVPVKKPQRGHVPHEVFKDYNPCQQCVKEINGRVVVIEVTHTPYPPNQPCLNEQFQLYPTGRRVAIDDKLVQEILVTPEFLALAKREKMVYMTPDIFEEKIIKKLKEMETQQ
jgi:hypothetical protein